MILESVIARVIEQQREHLMNMDTGLNRELQPNILSLKSHALIISGIRRCGKSTLLLQMIKNIEMGNYLFLNFDTPQLYGFSMNDCQRLDNIIGSGEFKTLFFDEMQLVEGWEMYVRQKLDQGFRVIVTGSNASMLSRELGTRLTGRHITQELFPFSYAEFLAFLNFEPSPETLSKYLEKGGFPEYLKSGDVEQIISLYNDILIRDIVARYGIKDSVSLTRLANYLIANVGNKVTATKLKQPLQIGATSTILTWLSYLEHSYLFMFLPKFSYSAKVQLINPRKVYAIDPGLISVVSASKTEDAGRKLENLVFLHLRRQYKELYYFVDKGECDFVAFRNGKVAELVQVCWELNPDNLDREVNGISNAMNFFRISRSTIVTYSSSDLIEMGSTRIDVVPAHEFLL